MKIPNNLYPYNNIFESGSIDSDSHTPYSKSVYLLKSHGAKPNLTPFKEIMTHRLNVTIESLTKLLSDPDGEIDKKTLQPFAEEAQANLNSLKKAMTLKNTS